MAKADATYWFQQLYRDNHNVRETYTRSYNQQSRVYATVLERYESDGTFWVYNYYEDKEGYQTVWKRVWTDGSHEQEQRDYSIHVYYDNLYYEYHGADGSYTVDNKQYYPTGSNSDYQWSDGKGNWIRTYKYAYYPWGS